MFPANVAVVMEMAGLIIAVALIIQAGVPWTKHPLI